MLFSYTTWYHIYVYERYSLMSDMNDIYYNGNNCSIIFQLGKLWMMLILRNIITFISLKCLLWVQDYKHNNIHTDNTRIHLSSTNRLVWVIFLSILCIIWGYENMWLQMTKYVIANDKHINTHGLSSSTHHGQQCVVNSMN